MSIPLFWMGAGGGPPTLAARLVLPITTTVTLGFPWGTETDNPRDTVTVDESCRITVTVGTVA